MTSALRKGSENPLEGNERLLLLRDAILHVYTRLFVLRVFSASQISHNDYMLSLLLGETTVKGSNRL